MTERRSGFSLTIIQARASYIRQLLAATPAEIVPLARAARKFCASRQEPRTPAASRLSSHNPPMHVCVCVRACASVCSLGTIRPLTSSQGAFLIDHSRRSGIFSPLAAALRPAASPGHQDIDAILRPARLCAGALTPRQRGLLWSAPRG